MARPLDRPATRSDAPDVTTRRRRLSAVLVVISVVAAACGSTPGGDGSTPPEAAVDEEPTTQDIAALAHVEGAALETIRAVGRQSGSSILPRLVDVFTDRAPSIVGDLRTSVDALDAEKIRATAHNLKGMSANMGAMQFSALCAQLEAAGRSGELDEVQRLCVTLETALPEVCANLEAEKQLDLSEAASTPRAQSAH